MRKGYDMSDRVSRPFGVTVVFVVILFSGALALFSGIWRLVNRGDNVGWIPAAITVGIGLVYVFIAKGIANGSSAARFLVALATVCMLILCVWALVISPSLWPTLAIQILLGLIVLGLLYTAKASRFFRS